MRDRIVLNAIFFISSMIICSIPSRDLWGAGGSFTLRVCPARRKLRKYGLMNWFFFYVKSFRLAITNATIRIDYVIDAVLPLNMLTINTVFCE